MADFVFKIDNKEFNHLRILSFTQTFEVLDGKNSTRTLDGNMKRDIIGTYFNYKLKIKPEYSVDGMKEYNLLWGICSETKDSHLITIPYDVDTKKEGELTQNMIEQQMYITSGSRNMLKYDMHGTDYWGEGEFNFIAMSPRLKK